MRNTVGYPPPSQLNPLDLAELILRLLGRDAVDDEATLGVVDEAEIFARLFDGDDVHEAGGVGAVGADFAVDFEEALHEDGFCLAGVEGVLESENKRGEVVNFEVLMTGIIERMERIERGRNLLRMKTMRGRQSRFLCGPGEALGA